MKRSEPDSRVDATSRRCGEESLNRIHHPYPGSAAPTPERCPDGYHDELKRSESAFRKGTERLTHSPDTEVYQDDGEGRLWLRNCSRCHSTIARRVLLRAGNTVLLALAVVLGAFVGGCGHTASIPCIDASPSYFCGHGETDREWGVEFWDASSYVQVTIERNLVAQGENDLPTVGVHVWLAPVRYADPAACSGLLDWQGGPSWLLAIDAVCDGRTVRYRFTP